jgi:hypothetical protein
VSSERAPFVAMGEIGFFAGEISARPVVRTGGGIRLSKCRFQTVRRRSKLVPRKSNPPSIGHHPDQRLANHVPEGSGFFPHTASRDPRGARAPDHHFGTARNRGSGLEARPSRLLLHRRRLAFASARRTSPPHGSVPRRTPRAHTRPRTPSAECLLSNSRIATESSPSAEPRWGWESANRFARSNWTPTRRS